MNKTKIFTFLLFIIFLNIFSVAHSQLDFSIGATGGYLNGMHNAQYRYSCLLPKNIGESHINIDNPKVNSGFGGISAELSFLKGILPVSIIGRAVYEDLSFYQSKKGASFPATANDGYGHEIVVLGTTAYGFKVDYKLITTNFLIDLKLFNTGISLFVGPSFSFVVSDNLRETYNIVEPINIQLFRNPELEKQGYRYESNNRTFVYIDKPIPNKNSANFGLTGGIQWEYKIWNLIIAPYLAYNLGLTDVVSQGNPACSTLYNGDQIKWKIDKLYLGLDLRYAF